MAAAPLVVLDDDPTGTQAVAGVPVLLEWDVATIRAAAGGVAAVHLLTNTRALRPDDARARVRDATAAARAAQPGCGVVLRGDSTLRAHLLSEHLGVSGILFGDEPAVALLVPALPAAGRITRDGVHYLVRDGRRIPLHDTEYARDGIFAYRDATLLQWAQDRSCGYFPRAAGRTVPLERLRAGGADVVRDALAELSRARRPAVCAPDAETVADLALIAEGLEAAQRRGARVVVRCAPAFVGVLSGTLATGLVPVPKAPGGLLVVCGSYVPTTTRQLSALVAVRPGALVEADVGALAGPEPDAEIERLGVAASELLASGGLAVVATPRERPPGTDTLAAGERIADGLARSVRRVSPRPSAVVAKGGVTSAVTARVGLRSGRADVVGPVADGVALWHVALPDGGPLPYVVVPGNVGPDDLLVRLVAAAITPAHR